MRSDSNYARSTSLAEKTSHYWQLIKSHQTGLLLITGITGFISARCPILYMDLLLGLIISLFLAISGTTILNMVYDRDIDAKMNRTSHRPLPAGKIRTKEALAKRKAEGVKLGRPRGQSKNLKLDPHKEMILDYLEKKVSKASIAKILGCSPSTLYAWLKRHNIKV